MFLATACPIPRAPGRPAAGTASQFAVAGWRQSTATLGGIATMASPSGRYAARSFPGAIALPEMLACGLPSDGATGSVATFLENDRRHWP